MSSTYWYTLVAEILVAAEKVEPLCGDQSFGLKILFRVLTNSS